MEVRSGFFGSAFSRYTASHAYKHEFHHCPCGHHQWSVIAQYIVLVLATVQLSVDCFHQLLCSAMDFPLPHNPMHWKKTSLTSDNSVVW